MSQLEAKCILGGICVSAAALVTRVMVSVCMSVLLSNFGHGRANAVANKARNVAMSGLLLGLSCGGRDEVALLMVLQLSTAGKFSTQGLDCCPPVTLSLLSRSCSCWACSEVLCLSLICDMPYTRIGICLCSFTVRKCINLCVIHLSVAPW